MLRSTFPKQKDVIVINDIPVKSETEVFSAVSNMSLLTALRRGTIYSDQTMDGHKGIISTKIHPTYLDYSYYAPDNDNFKKDLKKRKDLTHNKNGDLILKEEEDLPGIKETYTLIPHQKDSYISKRLLDNFLGLLEEIKKVNPQYIIITGKWTLFLLCGVSSIAENMPKAGDNKPLGCILKYRNSIMQIHPCWEMDNILVTPLIHPVNAWGMQDKIPIINIDLAKAGWRYQIIKEKGIDYFLKPEVKYILGTNLSTIKGYFNLLEEKLKKEIVYVVFDIETMENSTILDCIGLTFELNRGLCIPFCNAFNANLFSVEEELEILLALKEVLENPNIRLIAHNGAYDLQVIYALWGINLNLADDTMVSAHILNNTLPKNLAFQASLHCEKYTYWKDESKVSYENYQDRWIYNIKDCCNTLEVFFAHKDNLENYPDPKLNTLYRRQIDKLHPLLLKAMYRGIRVDKERKEALFNFYDSLLIQVPDKINELLGFQFNPNSSQQKKKLFKEYFGIELITKQRKGQADSETCDAAAMKGYIEKYPLFAPFLTLLIEYTALSKFTKTFLGMQLDWDDRARTQYKITGTAFGRLASTKNVYGRGCMPINKAQCLTPDGWKFIAERPEVIAQYNEDGSIEFTKADWTIYEYEGQLSWINNGISGSFTPDHRFIYKEKGTKIYKEIKVENTKYLPWEVKVPISGFLKVNESCNLEDSWLQRFVMCSADGSKDGNNWGFNLTKQRKIDRFIEITKNIPKKTWGKSKKLILPDEGYKKIFPNYFLTLPKEKRQVIIEELQYWDGHTRDKHFFYYSTIPENAELIQTLCHITGYSASIRKQIVNFTIVKGIRYEAKNLYIVIISRKTEKGVLKPYWKLKDFKGKVGCPTVPSSMWLVKYNNKIHITGNCNMQNLPEKGKVQIHYLLELLGMRNNEIEHNLEDLVNISLEENYVE